eukprot:6390816-Amphidinium_carterae.1
MQDKHVCRVAARACHSHVQLYALGLYELIFIFTRDCHLVASMSGQELASLRVPGDVQWEPT